MKTLTNDQYFALVHNDNTADGFISIDLPNNSNLWLKREGKFKPCNVTQRIMVQPDGTRRVRMKLEKGDLLSLVDAYNTTLPILQCSFEFNGTRLIKLSTIHDVYDRSGWKEISGVGPTSLCCAVYSVIQKLIVGNTMFSKPIFLPNCSIPTLVIVGKDDNNKYTKMTTAYQWRSLEYWILLEGDKVNYTPATSKIPPTNVLGSLFIGYEHALMVVIINDNEMLGLYKAALDTLLLERVNAPLDDPRGKLNLIWKEITKDPAPNAVRHRYRFLMLPSDESIEVKD